MQTELGKLVEIITGLLLAGNLYFIKRLIAKIDHMDALLSGEVLPMMAKLDGLEKKMDEIPKLKQDVAILKFAVTQLEKATQKGSGLFPGEYKPQANGDYYG